ncbi:K+ dependent Na+ exchanger related-protein [Oleiphilus messinensis]|uniref:K+ dependent Na+ exchanger related-protein n=1 Tax=Oleiphilus messinensis TaxID=141451 RepID=A0A1Y0I962_9GAMM|nr:calcium/sodium antiporter [Oleiphilus messinensis]ARU56770.1 K+ dependent Na+ exchanger related-protein [Oleiphilus messinensis]
MDILLLLSGIALLSLGGEALIRGSLSASQRLGISPLLSGLIIVGFGTSAPELAVSLDAAVNERPDLAIGNVVGSNIGNIFLILGLCAVITPLAVRPLILRRDASMVCFASLLFILFANDQVVGIVNGIVLLLALIAYLLWAYLSEKVRTAPSSELHKSEAKELTALPKSGLSTTFFVCAGLILLIIGSKILLDGAVGLAEELGVSQAVIGLTLVAVGTSLPELTISIVAALRRHADVAVGNVLGSNIFNLLGILGISAILQPLQVHNRVYQFDQWVMIASSLLLFILLTTGRNLNRPEGTVLLCSYLAYLGFSFYIFAD